MLVSDVLDLVANLSIGLDNPTQDDEEIFLRYLNLAHFELFSRTASINPFVTIQSDVLNVNDGVVDNLTAPLFSIRSVYSTDSKSSLIPYSYNRILDLDPTLTQTGQPQYWYYVNNTLNVWPLWTKDEGIGVRYVVAAEPFDLNDDLSPLYPPTFHPLLVDGTCYYLFQTESGFKNETKMLKAEKRWMNGTTDLYNYLLMVGGKPIYSTFSNI